jgi:hypothetical protein
VGIRILKWFLALTLTLVVGIGLFIRLTGAVVRTWDGHLIGYTNGQWYFNELEKRPPAQDGPYVFISGGTLSSVEIIKQGDGFAKVSRPVESRRVTVRVDNAADTQFEVPLRENYPR